MCLMRERFQKEGFDGLLRPPAIVSDGRGGEQFNYLDRQFTGEEDSRRSPIWDYEPNRALLAEPYPIESIDFDLQSSYGLYNWELFFHIPLLVATRLSQTQRFEEAQRWFHYIFDPTDTSPYKGPARYWRVKPFFELAQEPPETLMQLLERIASGDAAATKQVEAWRDDPFNPHAIARLRLITYMKSVVMGYLDNLIPWADDLFRQDTRETVNEAIQLYLLAADLLGPRPTFAPPLERPDDSYADFTAADEFGNLWLDLESLLPIDPTVRETGFTTRPVRLLPYFCLPGNDKLLSYWDTVADRLFKIRHCQDIEGRLRELPLFDPPIDPGLLVRARAAGIDLRSALRGTEARPHYRFTAMHQKAIEFCGEVRSLGSALLSAFEKRDAEALGLLRSTHEQAMLRDMAGVRDRQVDEARESLEALRKSRLTIEKRLEFYSSREFMSPAETSAMDSQRTAHDYEQESQKLSVAASIAHLVPQIHATVTGGSEFGGKQVGDALNAAALVQRAIAGDSSFAASRSSTIGGYQRRQDDWNLQAQLATRELAQTDKQILAAEIRLATVEAERDNHRKQMDRAAEVDRHLRSKFTNEQLYLWMSGQLAALHYQAYQLALEMAQKAEAAARFELGLPERTDPPPIVAFGHSDSAHRYLSAGDALAHDLRRLDAYYLEHNKRRLEIASHISLRRLNGEALWRLRATGNCSFVLPPWVLDLDFPGLARRRIKSVSVSIPSVVGPYVGVHGILRLTEPEQRMIAISSGQGDAGLFQLDFRDERYLPFEGVSLDGEEGTSWQFTLPQANRPVDEANRPFDYGTISDLILHVQYTADPLGEPDSAHSPLPMEEGTFLQLVSVKHDFPTESHRLLSGSVSEVDVILDDRLFPYIARNRSKMKVTWLRDDSSELIREPMQVTISSEDAEGFFIVEYSLLLN
ncbi:hypothetical protein [Thiocapsa sp.]|uniref:Tc toxin subunit A-related protein n=1 Tax=Thiocapsa sp. TaxID=2024551 RepID=UPI003593F491